MTRCKQRSIVQCNSQPVLNAGSFCCSWSRALQLNNITDDAVTFAHCKLENICFPHAQDTLTYILMSASSLFFLTGLLSMAAPLDASGVKTLW